MKIGVRPSDAQNMFPRAFKAHRMSDVVVDLHIGGRDELGEAIDVTRADDLLVKASDEQLDLVDRHAAFPSS
jgi:hypothetical protein